MILSCLGILLISLQIQAQGTIFGTVKNSDMSVPADQDIMFFGFIANTDDEIRANDFVGAAFETGYWYDDFQNYLSASAFQQYDYFFFNMNNSESFNLSSTIPDSSFHQVDVVLADSPWLAPIYNLHAIPFKGTGVKIFWSDSGSNSYHVYRRDSLSNGSMFRIDNPSGDLADFGETDTFYIDANVDLSKAYDYLVIADDNLGHYSPPSKIVTASGSCINPALNDTDLDGIADPCDNCPSIANSYQEDSNEDGIGDSCQQSCCVLRGDIAIPKDGALLVNDLVFAVNYIFRGGPPPNCLIEGDCALPLDNDILVNDIVYMVNAVFRGGPAPPPC